MNISKLLAWFELNKRDLPWRQHPSPYGVWISEVMSQQTTLAAVVPYFNRWMSEFKSVHVLAKAREEHVLKAWAGLGYYSRARNLHKAAKVIANNGFPKSAFEWQQLPGVGPYTARAIGAIALGEAVLPVDGNVIRVLARQNLIQNPLQKRAQLARVHQAAEELVSKAKSGQYGLLAEALMELGATVCRPGALARCEVCPVSLSCQSLKRKQVACVPRPKERVRPIERQGYLVAYRRPNLSQQFLVRPVVDGQRLKGQFELPKYSAAPKGALKIGQIRHSITRYRDVHWVLDGGFFRGRLPDGHIWAEIEQVHLSTASRKALKLILNIDSASKLGKPT